MIKAKEINAFLSTISEKERSLLNDMGAAMFKDLSATMFNAASPNREPNVVGKQKFTFVAICIAVSSACDALGISTEDMAAMVGNIRRCPTPPEKKAEEPT